MKQTRAIPDKTLRACPFCGMPLPILLEKRTKAIGGIDLYFVRCPSCGVRTQEMFVKSHAVNAWNRRETD